MSLSLWIWTRIWGTDVPTMTNELQGVERIEAALAQFFESVDAVVDGPDSSPDGRSRP